MPSPSSATRAEVEKYSDDVLRNKIRCELPDCAACGTSPDLFRRHQARPRKFYILCETMVQTILCLVIRWRCTGCRKTFTQQPPFAFPRKRYTRESIPDFSARYVEDQTATYRATVLDDEGMEIFHALRSKQEPICNKILAHSTTYRWITCLGEPREILRSAQDLILRKNPASTVCRDLAALEICSRFVPESSSRPFGNRCSNAAGKSFTWRSGSGLPFVLPFSPCLQRDVPGDDLGRPPKPNKEEAYEAKR